MNDSMVMNAPNGPLNTKFSGHGQIEVDFVKCNCCGLTEECTLSYIETIRARYQGKWICGLCAEAVKDEILRCKKLISPDEAMARHFNFCNKFRPSGQPEEPTSRLITAMRQILRKSLECPKSLRSMPSSPMKNIGDGNIKKIGFPRSESCIPSLSLVDSPVLRAMGEERG
ncbi:uncharacterized protein LOC111387772 [Olea europaea var. sylvestris]|uniref:uncharacterized protein LOC111387772 n=1 Tax=Olea europaea var. sylvestris TaxID=158386 RepID=UPI000C1D4F58|nr:uncharacterized protein LOC111387772 [Olea europaea var. sylvestris]